MLSPFRASKGIGDERWAIGEFRFGLKEAKRYFSSPAIIIRYLSRTILWVPAVTNGQPDNQLSDNPKCN
jgi:hypothetical protein